MGRALDELQPMAQVAAREALAECKRFGIDTLVTCTYRSPQEQDQLYAQGRTMPGKRVTNAKANQSFHQFRVALDVYVAENGKIDWSGTNPKWGTMARIFKAHGFEWAGEWKRFREMPHFQMTGGHPLAYFQAGGKLKEDINA